MYKLIKANKKNIPLLEEFKINTFYNLPNDELENIKKYVHKTIPLYLSKYNLIVVDDKIVGSLLYYSYLDGVLLDELYIIETYRNKKIGTDIINNICLNNIVYLWVYQDNTKAINLYKKLGFVIIETTLNRYLMKKTRWLVFF